MQDVYSDIQIKELRLSFSNGAHHDVSIIDANLTFNVTVMVSYRVDL